MFEINPYDIHLVESVQLAWKERDSPCLCIKIMNLLVLWIMYLDFKKQMEAFGDG